MTTELIRGLYNIRPCHTGCVLTIGNFDGVHRGHQVLLERLKAYAKTHQVRSLVLTFEPQPMEFFAREKSVPRLTRFREKFYYLSQASVDQASVDQVLVIRFNAEFAALTAEEFIEKILHKKLNIKHIILGDDFQFGHARKGTVDLLKKASHHLGFTVETIPSVILDEERVSSTRIRKALLAANHAVAEKLLGHPYCMMGRVVYGEQLGRRLGFPTANIYLHRQVTPVHGIYIVRIHGLAATGLPGVANVGTRPTVGGTRTLLEVYIFDFQQTIYGKYVTVEFCEKLREEVRFANLDLLKQQMWKDAELARDYFIQRGELFKNASVDK